MVCSSLIKIALLRRQTLAETLEMKIDVRPGCTGTKGCGSARETNKNKKVTSKLQQGLNFTVNVDFWFYNDDF